MEKIVRSASGWSESYPIHYTKRRENRSADALLSDVTQSVLVRFVCGAFRVNAILFLLHINGGYSTVSAAAVAAAAAKLFVAIRFSLKELHAYDLLAAYVWLVCVCCVATQSQHPTERNAN